MAQLCSNDHCTECRGILVRTYRELRGTGYGDEKAFLAAVHVLELRHPGHTRDYYARLTAQWIEAETEKLIEFSGRSTDAGGPRVAVPAPSSILLLTSGLIGATAKRRRKRTK